ncbi:CRISPR-associated protein Cas9/Csn1, subtype II/NMEMI [Lacticaseibacillus paracasei]|nr:CRISPR-associated protein Cas9/Csn1, subtype II/NMEMI [Lacticaseibacillus paracasei]RND43948.1 CRISPR-associated protein Cas9/Csn1, subtype II/NMEMI [Lacticaseibacillus paracasei]RND70628.1 CRISPR-associated protein Cas9/Csn1, subtype II/NMEMI [Lacticaseibacillus paracasei]
MKTTDTYLIGEDVLPKQSLLYQSYEVLNELNNVRVNDNKLSSSIFKSSATMITNS